MDEQIIYRPRKKSKKKTLLTKEQVNMLRVEYSIHLTTKNTEFEALQILKNIKHVWTHKVLQQGAYTVPLTKKVNGKDIVIYPVTPKVLRYNKKGEPIFQRN